MPEDPAKPSAPVSNSPSADGPHDPPASGELPRLRSLAGSVAHDVNNLLVVMLHCLDQLEQASVAEPGREYVDQARFATQQAAAQLRHLQRGGEPLLEQDVDVDDVVRAVGSTLRIAGHGEGRVTLDLASRPGKVRGAAAELAVAVFNLVHNALEVSPAGKPVVVRTRARSLTATCSTHFRPLPAGDYVAIEVVDAGGGIAPGCRRACSSRSSAPRPTPGAGSDSRPSPGSSANTAVECACTAHRESARASKCCCRGSPAERRREERR